MSAGYPGRETEHGWGPRGVPGTPGCGMVALGAVGQWEAVLAGLQVKLRSPGGLGTERLQELEVGAAGLVGRAEGRWPRTPGMGPEAAGA